jgi:hypothetical protein
MIDRFGHIWRALVVAMALVAAAGAAAAQPQFKRALIYLEHNATDDDIEVRFVATSGRTGFAALRVIGPGERTVIDFKSPDSKLGISHLDLESPEPRNDGRVQTDFPEGKYRFEGTLVDGVTLRAEVTLSHVLPEAPMLLSPRPGQTDVPVRGAKLRWGAVADAVFCEVVLKEKNGGRVMRVMLPGGSTAFAVPDGFLVSAMDYELSVGAILQGGNRSYQEIEFTAQKR